MPWRVCLGLTTAAAFSLAGGPAGAATLQPTTAGALIIVVSPSGDDTAAGTVRAPIKTLPQAQVRERAALARGAAVTVVLEDGAFPLSAPLQLGPADSGKPNLPVRWVAAPGARPVISGGLPVTDWSVHDAAKGIWAASVPQGLDSRQLYLDGKAAPRAAVAIARSSATITTTGLTSPDPLIASLAGEPEQSRIEV